MEAGELVESKILMNPPRMEIIPHYREWWEKRKYTIVMLDLGKSLLSLSPLEWKTLISLFFFFSLFFWSCAEFRCAGRRE